MSAFAFNPNSPSTGMCFDLRSDPLGLCIYDHGAKEIAAQLAINTVVHTLTLQGHSIRDEGCTALADALVTNTALTSLNLQSNCIKGDGTLALARALQSNSTLSSLNLSYNLLSPDSVLELSKTLKTNSALTDVKLAPSNVALPLLLDEMEDNLERNRENAKKREASLFELALPSLDLLLPTD